MNLLELLGMVISTWALIDDGNTPRHPRDAVLMRGDNSSACSWIGKCRGGTDPRSGAVMRLMGGLEMGSDWCCVANHVRGVDNVAADCISRLQDPSLINDELCRLHPGLDWSRQVLRPAALALISGVLDSSTSEAQLRDRLSRLMHLPSVLGKFFVPP